MGFFTKRDAEGLPMKFIDLYNEAMYPPKKYKDDAVFKFKCTKKYVDVGYDMFKNGALECSSSADLPSDAEKVVDMAFSLVSCYENGTGCEIDYCKAWDSLMIIKEIGTYAAKNTNIRRNFSDKIMKLWMKEADYSLVSKVIQRDTDHALHYFRAAMDYSLKVQNKIDVKTFLGLMECPQCGNDEIQLAILLNYDFGQLEIMKGNAQWNPFPSTWQQCFELFKELDPSAISSNNCEIMYNEYIDVASRGNAYAQFKLGTFFLDGRYVEKDVNQGISLLEDAAEQNLYLAIDRLSNYYYYAQDNCSSKQEKEQMKQKYYSWSKKSDVILREVNEKYASQLEYLLKKNLKK